MSAKKRRRRIFYLLLLVPYVALLWVPFFNRIDPQIAGIPFFYWYQLLWVVLGALLQWPVWRLVGDRP